MPDRSQSQRNADILAARLLPPSDRPSLADLSQTYKISRERVRQIEANGRAKLMQLSAKHLLD